MKKRLHKIGRELVPIAVTVLVLFAARSSLADHYAVPTGSMEYTMMPGDRIIVDKRVYGYRFPFTDWKIVQGERVIRGEVVIFDSPEDGTRLVKRIVAVGGDTVTVQSGRISINGKYLLDKNKPDIEYFGTRIAKLNLKYGGGIDMVPTPVPEGFVLAVGDSRGNSRDGRIYGFIPENIIYGRAIAVYYRSNEGFIWKKL